MTPDYATYLLTLSHKLPEEARDLVRELEECGYARSGGYRELKRAEVGDRVVVKMDLSQEGVELIRSRGASNLELMEADDVSGRPEVEIPADEDLAYHDATKYRQWGFDGRGIDVGVVDTGLSPAVVSALFSGRIKASRSEIATDDLPAIHTGADHGSKMCPLAVPPRSRLVLGRGIVDGDSVGTYATVFLLYWMVDEVGVDAINMSLSFESGTSALSEACHNARQAGVPLFGSAGNQGSSVKRYPAGYGSVQAIGAADRTTGDKASFSNYGSWVWGWGSGVSVKTYDTNANIYYVDGTSPACALATFVYATKLTKGVNITGPGGGQGDRSANRHHTLLSVERARKETPTGGGGGGRLSWEDGVRDLPSHCGKAA